MWEPYFCTIIPLLSRKSKQLPAMWSEPSMMVTLSTLSEQRLASAAPDMPVPTISKLLMDGVWGWNRYINCWGIGVPRGSEYYCPVRVGREHRRSSLSFIVLLMSVMGSTLRGSTALLTAT